MAEANPPDDALQLEEIRKGMAQELSRFRESLSEAKAQIEELQTLYDESKTQLEELTSTDGIKGEYELHILDFICLLCFRQPCINLVLQPPSFKFVLFIRRTYAS